MRNMFINIHHPLAMVPIKVALKANGGSSINRLDHSHSLLQTVINTITNAGASVYKVKNGKFQSCSTKSDSQKVSLKLRQPRESSQSASATRNVLLILIIS